MRLRRSRGRLLRQTRWDDGKISRGGIDKRMTRGLFIFRRDLRLEDNLGLIALLKACDEVACMFVGTPEQLQKNKLRNPRAIAFLSESLADLAGDLKKRGGSLYVA